MSSDDEAALQTPPSLLMRLRNAQDDEAWRIFMLRYGPIVYRYCRGRGLQDADASDVAQEVFLSVARAISNFQYDATRGRFRNWLGTIARNCVNKFLSRQGARADRPVQPAPLEAVEGGTEDEHWNELFNAHVLRMALERARPHFDAATWKAFAMVWQQGRSVVEAAQATGKSVAMVYVAKARVLKRLRQEVLVLAEDQPCFGRRH